MFSVDNYISAIKENLDKHSELLIGNLKNIFTYNFYSEIEILDFCTFIEPTNFEFSIRMFSMDKEANEVFNKGDEPRVFAGSVEIIPDVPYYHLEDHMLDDFIENFYENNYPAIYHLEQRVFSEWFSMCWEKAGGHTVKIPSYFDFHDDDNSYDLKNSKWINDEEKWS